MAILRRRFGRKADGMAGTAPSDPGSPVLKAAGAPIQCPGRLQKRVCSAIDHA
jgi:hypothetical protein